MSNEKLRRQITSEAARLLCVGQESDYYRAKLKAAKRICQGWVHPADLPKDREIRDEVQVLLSMQQAGDALEQETNGNGHEDDERFRVYRRLLAPLATVQQKPEYH